MQDVVPLLFLVGIALVMWLLLVRPQARRQRELAQMQSSLEVGDEVMLTSGVLGTLRELDDEGFIRLEIAEGVVIKVARQAVGQVVHEDPATTHGDTDVSEEN